MKYQYIRAFIVLLAGLLTLIVNMKTGRDVTLSLLIVLVVLLVFYVLATLMIEILQRAMEKKEEQNTEPSDDSEEEDTIDAEAYMEDGEESVQVGFDDEEE